MILIVGGAGYIGSHANKELSSRGFDTLVFDNLVYGHRDFVRWGKFVEGDLASMDQLRELFGSHSIEAVMHFASYINVGESVTDPAKYYENNVTNTLNLMNVMKEFGVGRFIFSSTCAVYGLPLQMPLTETHPRNPVNPYGETKLIIEKALADYERAYGMRHVLLRYFNAAGADGEALIGENHRPETHLIPLVMHAATGHRSNITIYGTDYPTPDGTCIRDYIHVTDLADAHILALQHLMDGGDSDAFNLGNGNGYSVREVIREVAAVTGRDIPVVEGARRDGDPAVLIGSSDKIKAALGWKPRFDGLDVIVRSAWKWHRHCFGDGGA